VAVALLVKMMFSRPSAIPAQPGARLIGIDMPAAGVAEVKVKVADAGVTPLTITPAPGVAVRTLLLVTVIVTVLGDVRALASFRTTLTGVVPAPVVHDRGNAVVPTVAGVTVSA
jgi:hypothetical protein